MGTYSRPGLTRGEAALVDNSASTINKELQSLGVQFENQAANIELNKEAALTQQMEVYKQASEIDSMQGENKLSSSMASALRKAADDLYYTTINSMGEDQTDTLRKETNLLNSIENLGGNLGALNIDATKLKEMIDSDQSDFISINSDPKFRKLYRNIALFGGAGSDVNGVKPMGVRIENGNIILSQESEEGNVEFSLNQYSKARENGAPGHIQFVDKEALGKGYQGDWEAQTKKYPLLTRKITDNRGNTKTVKEIKLYEQQSKEVYESIKNDPQGIATLSSDDWQFFNANGFYQAEKDANGNVTEKWTGSEDQRIRLQKAKADYLQDTYSELDRTQQQGGQNVAGSITYNDPKGGKGESPSGPKHSEFIESLGSITDAQETSSGLKGVPAVADAKPGKIYVNANDGQRYRFNGKTKKYDKVDKSDKDLETLRVRKLADIKKYLKKQGGVYSGDNKKVIKDFEGDKKDLDPNGLYKKGGTEANPTYEIIDLEKTFTDDVLMDPAAMEKNLNAELGITIPKSR